LEKYHEKPLQIQTEVNFRVTKIFCERPKSKEKLGIDRIDVIEDDLKRNNH